MDRSNWLSLAIRILAIICILIAITFCLTNKHWHLQTPPIAGFIFAFLTVIALLTSLIITNVFQPKNFVFLSYIMTVLMAWMMSLASTVLFGVTIRVCVQNIFGKCTSYYCSTTFIVATIFAFLCGLLCFLDLLRAFLFDFFIKKIHHAKESLDIAIQTQHSPTLIGSVASAQRSSSSISRYVESTSSSMRIAHIRYQDPLQTDI